MLKILALLAVLTPVTGWAQARGGTCNGFICDLTGFAVLLVLIGFLLASVAASVKRRGVVRGILSHGGVQFLLGYVAILAVLAGLFVGLLAHLGKV